MTQSELIADTAENKAIILALKALSNTIGKIYWHGNTVHDTLDKCLRALNNQSNNSGWYNPIPTRINGANGIYMINQSGSIFWEARIIREGDEAFRIEYLDRDGDQRFEQIFCKSMQLD